MRFLFLILITAFGFRLWDQFGDSDLRILFFDVGQGDAALLRWGRGKSFLIDSGGGFQKWNHGKRTLFLELTRLGVLTLDFALLSHPDKDHGEGFKGILEQLSIRKLFVNQAFLEEKARPPLLEEILLLAKTKQTAIERITESLRQEIAGARFTFLAPSGFSSHNDQSLVLEIEYANCKIVFTGDIEKQGEAWTQEKLNAPIDVLKVAHHGSRTSSSKNWLFKVRPKLAVISSGKGNSYGHPHREPLSRFRINQTQMLRTDFHGYVSLRVSKRGEITCESALGFCGRMFCRGAIKYPSAVSLIER